MWIHCKLRVETHLPTITMASVLLIYTLVLGLALPTMCTSEPQTPPQPVSTYSNGSLFNVAEVKSTGNNWHLEEERHKMAANLSILARAPDVNGSSGDEISPNARDRLLIQNETFATDILVSEADEFGKNNDDRNYLSVERPDILSSTTFDFTVKRSYDVAVYDNYGDDNNGSNDNLDDELGYGYDLALAAEDMPGDLKQTILQSARGGAANQSIYWTYLVEAVGRNCTNMNSTLECKDGHVQNENVTFCCFNKTRITSGKPTRRPQTPSWCEDVTWQSYLKITCVPPLFILGLIGNSLSFVVMCSDAYRRKSYGYYLRALAVFDNLTLLINLVYTLNDANYELQKNSMPANATFEYVGFMSGHTTATCKITEFLCRVVYLMCSWLVVCFTIDRFIAVCFPLLRVRYCTERSATGAIGTIFCLIMVSQSYHLYYVQRLDRDSNPHQPCHAPTEKDVRLVYFGLNYFWFSFLLRFAIPLIVIAVCNGFIIYHIQRMRRERRLKDQRKVRKASSLAICTLYAVCGVFVVTLLPCAVISIIQFTDYIIKQKVTVNLYCTLKVLWAPFEVLRLLNYSTNAILYGLTGRQFRREFRRLLLCCMGRVLLDKRSVQTPEPGAPHVAAVGAAAGMHEMLLLRRTGVQNISPSPAAALVNTAEHKKRSHSSQESAKGSKGSSKGSHNQQ